jgi:hypothetical protein
MSLSGDISIEVKEDESEKSKEVEEAARFRVAVSGLAKLRTSAISQGL